MFICNIHNSDKDGGQTGIFDSPAFVLQPNTGKLARVTKSFQNLLIEVLALVGYRKENKFKVLLTV